MDICMHQQSVLEVGNECWQNFSDKLGYVGISNALDWGIEVRLSIYVHQSYYNELYSKPKPNSLVFPLCLHLVS